jgi:hypothetical protein
MQKTLFLLLALVAIPASAEICDVNQDAQIDKRDLSLISKSRGQSPQYLDPRDSNLDGAITPADVQVCIRLCDLPGCAVQ